MAEAINAGNLSVHKHKIHGRASAAGNVVTPNFMFILIMNTALFKKPCEVGRMLICKILWCCVTISFARLNSN